MPKGIELGSRAFLDEAATAFNTLQALKGAIAEGLLSSEYFDDFFLNLRPGAVEHVDYVFVTVSSESKSPVYKIDGISDEMRQAGLLRSRLMRP